MKKKTYKIIICISLVVMLFTNFSGVFGATNPDYTPTVQVTENALDSKIKDSILLDALANMINAIASLAEYLIGSIFQTLTGDNIFPWADRIIFNGIGFLDINFLNPADNSLFVDNGSDSILGQVVKSVYSTIFSLAVLFLGVAVGVMAIRLAISSIAAEKAKYKQAIVNWVTCIVMLFLMHYILAFVFWVNEQLVQIASGILIQTIEERGLNTVDFQEALDAVLSPSDRVELYLKSTSSWFTDVGQWFAGGDTLGDTVRANSEISNRFLTNDDYVKNRMVYFENDSTGGFNFGASVSFTKEMAYIIGENRLVQDVLADKVIYNSVGDGQSDENIKNDNLKKAKSQGYYDVGGSKGKVYVDKNKYIGSEEYFNDLKAVTYVTFAMENEIFDYYRDNPEINVCNEKNPNMWTYVLGMGGAQKVASELQTLLNDKLGFKTTEDIKKLSYYDKNNVKKLENFLGQSAINKMVNLRLKNDRYILNAGLGNTSTSATDIIAGLGSFFKQSAYVYTTEEVTNGTGDTGEVITGWRASKLSVTGALLYAIFIFQSCMYLIMYVKRLFYVMMLSMFGPIVVIYDFFMKSAS